VGVANIAATGTIILSADIISSFNEVVFELNNTTNGRMAIGYIFVKKPNITDKYPYFFNWCAPQIVSANPTINRQVGNASYFVITKYIVENAVANNNPDTYALRSSA
jgi:hypothetical protein